MTRHTVSAYRTRLRLRGVPTYRVSSLGLGTLYTPGWAGGWTGPERWAVTRAGAVGVRR